MLSMKLEQPSGCGVYDTQRAERGQGASMAGHSPYSYLRADHCQYWLDLADVDKYLPNKEPLIAHLKHVREIHHKDIERGFGKVYLPNALERKYPNTNREWGWQWVFLADLYPCAESRRLVSF